mgnify:FL=1
MNEEDLRDCFAMFRSITGLNADDCYKFADEMLEARKKEKSNEEDTGIAAVVPKRTRKR